MTDIVDSSEYFPSNWIALLIPHFPSIELFCRICSLSLMNWISPSILTLGPPFCIAPLRWYCRCSGSSEYQFQLLSVQYAMKGRKMPLTRSLPLCPVVCRAETKVFFLPAFKLFQSYFKPFISMKGNSCEFLDMPLNVQILLILWNGFFRRLHHKLEQRTEETEHALLNASGNKSSGAELCYFAEYTQWSMEISRSISA